MNTFLWIAQGFLAVAFLITGVLKLARSREQLVASGQNWAADFAPGLIRAIGVAEIAGALGLVLPGITGIAVVLVPLAATGLAIDMAGAFITHARRGERGPMLMTAALFVLLVLIAWGRFGPYPLG